MFVLVAAIKVGFKNFMSINHWFFFSFTKEWFNKYIGQNYDLLLGPKDFCKN